MRKRLLRGLAVLAAALVLAVAALWLWLDHVVAAARC